MKQYCCIGYCIDLLRALLNTSALNYTFEVHLASDLGFGKRVRLVRASANESARPSPDGDGGEHSAGEGAGAGVADESDENLDLPPAGEADTTGGEGRARAGGRGRDGPDWAWNGAIGELLADKADLIVAPLIVSRTRLDALLFTKPFKYQSLSILVRKVRYRIA